jgi:ribonuclease HI
MIQDELDWWTKTLTENTPRPFTTLPPQATVTTDACPLGWGGTVKLLKLGETVMMHGRWRSIATSNALECRAVERTLRRLKQLPAGRDVHSVVIRSDNSTTVYNINRRNATASLLPPLASLLRFAERAQIEMIAEHVPGIGNATADALSRISPGGDYRLNLNVLRDLLKEWGLQIDADLFAVSWNAKHEVFWSLRRSPRATGRDAFLCQWSRYSLPLLHPPIPLIPKVLKRLQQERMRAIIILPNWRWQPWSRVMTQMTLTAKVLGPAATVLTKGSRMARVRAELPPGLIVAVLADTKTM